MLPGKTPKDLDRFSRIILSELITLLTVVEKRGVNRAAKELDIARQAVSRRISIIEENLEGPLLDRKVRGTGRLTPLGKRTLLLARSVLRELDQFVADVDRLRSGQDLRIASITSVWLAEKTHLEEGYRKRMRAGSLLLVDSGNNSHAISARVEDGRADIGIVSYPPLRMLDKAIAFSLWREERFVLAVSARRMIDSRFEHARVSARDLSELHSTFISIVSEHPMGVQIDRYFKKHRVRFPLTLSRDSISEMKQAVVNDDGISILPETTVREERKAGRLKVLRLKDSFYRPVGFLYRKDSVDRPAVKAFLECFALDKRK